MERFILSLIIAIGGITGLVLYQIFLSEEQVSNEACLPNDISQIKLNFPIKTPSVLPNGYSLQGIEVRNHMPESVIFYYADRPLCIQPFSDFTKSQLHISIQKELNTEGHAIYSSNNTKQIIGYNVTNLSPMTSLEFRQAWLKSSSLPNGSSEWNAIDINSYKGVDRMENNVAHIMFLNDKDQTLYGIGGTFPMNELLIVAKSFSS